MRNIAEYTKSYEEDYGFEGILVKYRQRKILDLIQHSNPSVLEIGCGKDFLVQRANSEGIKYNKWVVVEPSVDFCDLLIDRNIPKLKLLNGYLEQFSDYLRTIDFDLIICSGLLHEVIDPVKLLSEILELMSDKTRLHVNVPNGNSMHRELGVFMGILGNEFDLTDRNIKLQQHSVFSLDTLSEIVYKVGLVVEESGGYFLKPFSHVQMAKVKEILGLDVLDALFKYGEVHPHIAAEIYVECILGDR